MNAAAGTARALARSVRDVISWRGQHRHVRDGGSDLASLPPVALFWGDRDPVIPISHATATASLLGRAPLIRFPECGHFPHRQKPTDFARALEAFLNAPVVRVANVRCAARRESARAGVIDVRAEGSRSSPVPAMVGYADRARLPYDPLPAPPTLAH